MLTKERLAERVAKAVKGYEGRKVRQRERYRYARDMGFSVKEAQILATVSPAEIRRLAEEEILRLAEERKGASE